MSSQKRITLLKPGELKQPKIAFPTLFLFVTTLLVWGLTASLGFQGYLPVYLTLPIQAISMFVLFTPCHDAAHSSVGKLEYKFLNEVVGRVYTWIMLAPFPAFRWAHLQHHKHTNTVHDPDMWSSGYGCPKILLPLFWGTQDYHYYFPYLRHAFIHKTRPLWEVIECLASVVLMHYVAYRAYVLHPYETVMFWILPNRLGLIILAYMFDYVPHYPQAIPGIVNPYKATAYLDGLFRSKDMKLDYLLLYQNYHNIHHLYPTIPFYLMGQVWSKYEAKLRELGTSINQVF
jgi:ring-1,2-phenylacetyl-CoA epoxidase subunit PaaE